MKRLNLCVAFTLLAAYAVSAGAQTAIPLAKDEKALLPIVTADNASERVKDAARNLSTYLGRISGAEFPVETGDGQSGIAVGLPGDLPSLNLQNKLQVNKIADREAYILKSHSSGLYVIGATELAVEHAVWDLLHRLGHRQFFPGRAWEIIPSRRNLQIEVDVLERPDYLNRRIWYGFGLADHNARAYKDWCSRNRTASGFTLNISHAYESFIRRNKAAFDTHPEYLGLLDGQRKSSKLCIGNADLRRLIVDHAIRYFEEDPARDSISMDPSDGGGWCECEKCAALGSVSDRALTLANQVARALEEKCENKYVGMYAYNYHSPPPAIRVHPNVIISIATSFIKGGYSLDELITGWSRQGATIGIREYYAVFPWDRDQPGKSRGSNLAYLQRTIPNFHSKGARFMSAESSDNWGCNGLGYYIASRILWDIDRAEGIDSMVDDFLTKAFGPARESMSRFYELINGANNNPVCEDLIGRLYRLLESARNLTEDPDIHTRLDHLALYVRYVELYRKYSNATGPKRQLAFEKLIRHGYRMRHTMMVHTKALYRDLVTRDKGVHIPEDAQWSVPEDKNPWKSSDPYTESELRDYVEKGIANHRLRNFEPVEFSRDLIPVTELNLPPAETTPFEITGRGVQTFYTWVDSEPATIRLEVTGGLIAHYRNRGNAKVDLWKVPDARESTQPEKPVAHGETAPDGVQRRVELHARETGLHKIAVKDGDDMTSILWDPNMPVTIISSLGEPTSISGRYSLYFYTPKGTGTIGLYSEGSGTILDPSGRIRCKFDANQPGYHSVPVPPAQSGKLWKLDQCTGAKRLMTVPPCLAPNPASLLLPREVVEADSI